MNKKLILIALIFIAGCASNKSGYIPQRDFSKCYSVHECVKAIQVAITDNWSRPDSARNGIQVTINLSLLPDGSIKSISIGKASGNKAFDASAISATENAAPFTELSELDRKIFNKGFSKVELLFMPMDLAK